MTEALATLMPEAVMEYTLDGTEPERVGNRHKDKAPHNVFRCRGEESWVAISVDDETQFQALAQTAGSPEWASDERFATSEARLQYQDDLEPLIQEWTVGLDAEEVLVRLQNAGVPAGRVLDSAQVLSDPHMVQRGFVQFPCHPEVGSRPLGAFSWSVDGDLPGVVRSAPVLGEHNRKVFQELLQLPNDEYDRLVDSGAIS